MGIPCPMKLGEPKQFFMCVCVTFLVFWYYVVMKKLFFVDDFLGEEPNNLFYR